MAAPQPQDIAAFAALDDFREWLAENHARRSLLWLRLFKKGSGIPTIGKQEAIDEALCWGWVDGQLGKGDENSFLIRFTPRRPGSKWSMINTERIDRMMAEGRMQTPGLIEVEAAKADGRWQAAYAGQGDFTLPEDLMAAIGASEAAARRFTELNRQNRFALYYRLTTAKKPETRRKRIEDFVAMLERGETFYPNGNR